MAKLHRDLKCFALDIFFLIVSSSQLQMLRGKRKPTSRKHVLYFYMSMHRGTTLLLLEAGLLLYSWN